MPFPKEVRRLLFVALKNNHFSRAFQGQFSFSFGPLHSLQKTQLAHFNSEGTKKAKEQEVFTKKPQEQIKYKHLA
jgi:hypothetical protein